MEQETPESGLDRRKLIKRAGIVTAGVAAWSTPMVTSLASAAHAAASPQTPCANCGVCGTYDLVNLCGTSGPLQMCVCGRDVHGQCACWENYYCGSVAACGPNQSCPPGYTCMVTCCGTEDCVPNCGTNFARSSRDNSSGPRKTATGQMV